MALIIRVFKAWKTQNIENAWSNTYEISTASLPTDQNATDMANFLANAERQLVASQVQFIQATISTWVEDSTPYNPATFVTVPLTQVGVRVAPDTDWLAGDACLFVRKKMASGRSGRVYYRGALTKADVESDSNLQWKMVAASAQNNGGATFTAYRNAMLPILAAGNDPGGKLAIIGRYADANGNLGAPVERIALDLQSAGVRVISSDHKYYDVANT